ncbi:MULTISPECIES: hypothetical protein [unclassified Coleofasciculus]|uniref:hypothetical protein n=1 Tax=Cyanophyceae TaxID=3028117 RepID=UPI001683B0DB|nr:MULTISPECIES: hypothetical protein [unclassified Coleofasciculus]MBD1880262.1 hypothetical protein [Coleofasciculus sp. FACHB-T130]MBD1898653.1 hypothetical protein [Coleofasciculus sp. FACHB-125]
MDKAISILGETFEEDIIKAKDITKDEYEQYIKLGLICPECYLPVYFRDAATAHFAHFPNLPESCPREESSLCQTYLRNDNIFRGQSIEKFKDAFWNIIKKRNLNFEKQVDKVKKVKLLNNKNITNIAAIEKYCRNNCKNEENFKKISTKIKNVINFLYKTFASDFLTALIHYSIYKCKEEANSSSLREWINSDNLDILKSQVISKLLEIIVLTFGIREDTTHTILRKVSRVVPESTGIAEVTEVVPESTGIAEVTDDNKKKIKPFRKSFTVTGNSVFFLSHVTHEKRPTVYQLNTKVETVFKNRVKDRPQLCFIVEALYGGKQRPKTAFSIQFFEDSHFFYSEPQPKDVNHIEDIVNDWLTFTQSFYSETREKIYSFKRLAQAVNDEDTPIYSLLTFILFTQFQRPKFQLPKAEPLNLSDFYGALIIAYRAGVSLELIESCFGQDEQAIEVLRGFITDSGSQSKYLEGSLADTELKKAIFIDFTSDI